MNPIILTHVPAVEIRDYFTRWMDARQEIRNWLAPHLGIICLISTIKARELSELLHQANPALYFITIDYSSWEAVGGWMPKEVWAFLNQPKPSGMDFISRSAGLLPYMGKK